MDARESFVRGEASLEEFVAAFVLDVSPFLALLRRHRAVATGVDFVSFVTGRWKAERKSSPRGSVLDILFCGQREVAGLRRFLEASGYRVARGACSHHMGEWRAVPGQKRICMVRGRLGQRAIHLVELPRSPVQTLVSRTYGSMAGTYLTGGGRVVSLFPHLTLVQRRCWVPVWMSSRTASLLEAKYPGWKTVRSGQYAIPEVDASSRSVGDDMVFHLDFSLQGQLLPLSRRAHGW